MQKTGSRKRDRMGKAARAPKTVDEYLTRIPEPAHTALGKMRAAIRSAVPREATEVISYGIPAFKDKNVLVWFAAFSNHCSLFPTASIIQEFSDELQGFSTAKGTVQFPLDRPLPTALIKRMVQSRVAQVKAKQLR